MTFRLTVLSPENSLGLEVLKLILPGLEGNYGVLPRHAPEIIALREGVMMVVGEGFEEYYTLGPGLAEVLPEKTTVITEYFKREV
ncbi:F0F1 ATP synthase subunit epsilon [Thermosediminibacter oceani]|uniref:ATPase, F1 complex, delta/epsilon subunit n=1 Tax=Thermosediminibacter oceani (strain ATCC BAA-1034 / DSM 16646 / JW/IW-1228P) TaxID=555079 RepID=D9RZW2_THEOJ|nr:ATPase F1 subunit delta/epsilon subunit [Thermosediminibacter oceani]ADL08739.1 ATPase, F1 complex, delta/epsilon subunit [Thermosediminibacter oceani DSM 16646]